MTNNQKILNQYKNQLEITRDLEIEEQSAYYESGKDVEDPRYKRIRAVVKSSNIILEFLREIFLLDQYEDNEDSEENLHLATLLLTAHPRYLKNAKDTTMSDYWI